MENALLFNRNRFITSLNNRQEWDVIVIGGGATGLGIALDSATRGYATLLLEQSDFAKCTSSRSTKLVHGGVRYLAQGNIRLVYDGLRERGIIRQNAPHLVKKQAFVIPCYSRLSKIKYLAGLMLYDALSGRYSMGKSAFLNRKKLSAQFPNMQSNGLVGGIEYFDSQFDDARLAINLAQTAAEKGASLLNYCKVTGLTKNGQRIGGVLATDLETNNEYRINGKVVINATGVFVDAILQMDKPGSKPLVRPSQGAHLVVGKSFLPANSALMIPRTADGRVLFAIPWHGHVLLGTTDTPLDAYAVEPVALQQEIDFILTTVKQYLKEAPGEKDVLSVFAGLRPLAAPEKATGSTKEISRDHKLLMSDSGLVTITGGKWTTYRKMAEATLNKVIETGLLPPAACTTKNIRIHGCSDTLSTSHLAVYGSDEKHIRQLMDDNPSLSKPLIGGLPYTEAEVVWAVRHEMARTVEDVLARRIRLLFLDAGAAKQAAVRVAALMATALHLNKAWESTQVEDFGKLAQNYLIQPTLT